MFSSAKDKKRCGPGAIVPACEWCPLDESCPICCNCTPTPWLMNPDNGDIDDLDVDASSVGIQAHPPRFRLGDITIHKLPKLWSLRKG